MNHKIKILPPVLANQIAAGEVVNGPASIVKELVENAIDAGAKKIDIQLKKGGIQSIIISDDGCGIPKDELELALSRHATSKISNLNDFAHIKTLGFRGEALASISSVSKVVLSSKPAKQEIAWQIISDATSTGSFQIKPCAHPTGTTLEISELFFNIPARRKFLRTELTEFQKIKEIVLCLALSHFSISFQLKHNDKLIFQTPIALDENSKNQRLQNLLGENFLAHASLINIERHGLALSGWLCSSHYSRSQKDQQYFYINGRLVHDKIISYAIHQAYQDVLYGQRHPAFVLYFTCEPELVDVNVHPMKHEVRFRDTRLIRDFISYALSQALNQMQGFQAPEKLSYFPQNDFSTRTNDISNRTQEAVASNFIKSSNPINPLSFSSKKQTALPLRETLENYEKLYGSNQTENQKVFLGYALAQLHRTFILAENEQGLVLVDMHAAHERIIYEEMKKNIEEQNFPQQHLLMPIILKCSASEADTAEEYQSELLKMGFHLERFSQDSFRVNTIPTVLQHLNVAELLHDIILDLHHQEGLSNRFNLLLMEKLGNMACKKAIMTNHTLSLEEMNALLRKMEQTPRYGQCNHGRPTVHHLSLEEIDKLFLRGR